MEDSVKSLQKMEVRDGEMQGLVVEGKGPRRHQSSILPNDRRGETVMGTTDSTDINPGT